MIVLLGTWWSHPADFHLKSLAFCSRGTKITTNKTPCRETFWNTIASTTPQPGSAQIARLWQQSLTLLLYFRPHVRIAMKVFMALLNFWIAGVYYSNYCEPREYKFIRWRSLAIMVHLSTTSWSNTPRWSARATTLAFVALLFAMPSIYPLSPLALGRTFPMITPPVMSPFGMVFTISCVGVFGTRQHRAGDVPLLCHRRADRLKVYFFGIPEDYLLACSIVPRSAPSSFSANTSAATPAADEALAQGAQCAAGRTVPGIIDASPFTMLHQLNLFTDI